MPEVTVAATQMGCTKDCDQNISNAEKLVVNAAEQGAQIVLLQELFETLYFCQEENWINRKGRFGQKSQRCCTDGPAKIIIYLGLIYYSKR